jgi:hypothetical protein
MDGAQIAQSVELGSLGWEGSVYFSSPGGNNVAESLAFAYSLQANVLPTSSKPSLPGRPVVL